MISHLGFATCEREKRNECNGSSNDKIIDVIMIRFPAPEEPPMIATIRLGTIAKDRVKKFRIHGFILKSGNPCTKYFVAYVSVIVELWPDASKAIAKTLELQLPKTCLSKKEALFKSKS
ncbi:hypothetical protein ACH5RR_003897 [Cinchona calisaya]|uniref:Uncharacterized protein n=1 Tax=Cinchona calisaya TaxID=153742 RepID=A0ABD3AW50_9GENT